MEKLKADIQKFKAFVRAFRAVGVTFIFVEIGLLFLWRDFFIFLSLFLSIFVQMWIWIFCTWLLVYSIPKKLRQLEEIEHARQTEGIVSE